METFVSKVYFKSYICLFLSFFFFLMCFNIPGSHRCFRLHGMTKSHLNNESVQYLIGGETQGQSPIWVKVFVQQSVVWFGRFETLLTFPSIRWPTTCKPHQTPFSFEFPCLGFYVINKKTFGSCFANKKTFPQALHEEMMLAPWFTFIAPVQQGTVKPS